MEWRYTSWRSLLIAAITLSAICCGGVAFYGTRPTNGIYVQQLEDEIKKQLPTGSSPEQVRSWLTSHEFEPWEISDAGQFLGIGTTIPNSSWLQPALIDVEFYFDQQGRLVKFLIDRIAY